MGLVKRPMYRPEREPARRKPWHPPPGMKLTEADLSTYEAYIGLYHVMQQKGVKVGILTGYDPQLNQFSATGKRYSDRKVVDVRVAGSLVSATIIACRLIANVKKLTRPLANR